MKAKHIKTGKIYEIICRCINATNSENEKEMVIYKDQEQFLFVRESKEFLEKFEMIEEEEAKKENSLCEWKHEEFKINYEISCGNQHTFEFHFVEDYEFVYCPFCGKKITVKTLENKSVKEITE